MSTAVSIVRTLLGLLFDHTIGNIVRMIPIIRLPKLERPVSRGFLALLLVILFFGLTMLFSASYSSAYASSGKLYSIIKPQVMIAIVGLFFMWVLSNINYRALRLMSESLYIITIVLLILALLSPQDTNGTYRWVYLPGGASFQPSELVKLAFILAGAATLDRLFAKRNLIFTVLFSAYCVGCLALMSDFGTALVFFVAFLCIAFLRTGDLASIVMMTAAAGFAGGLVLHFKPYVAQRFTVWRHAWEFTQTTGYQQSRTMSAAASGGLFGTGPEDAWLKYVGAANTDLVFGVVSEEFGLLLALVCVGAVMALAVFALRSGDSARSGFYAIAACAAASMLIFQTTLNVLGAVDILPLTGVTFPFVSMGGSSMLSCWGLLAYLKAADVRRPPEERSPEDKPEKPAPKREGFFEDMPEIPVDEIFGKEGRS